MSPRRWTLALVGWTLLVWTTRIGNIWNDADLGDGERWGRTALAASFTALAAAAVYAIGRHRSWRQLVVCVLAGWTIAVWVVRAAGIATGDHDAAFITVHVVLAAASIALSVLAIRSDARARRPTGEPEPA